MKTVVADYLSKLRLGRVQTHNQMSVVPLFSDEIDCTEYLTMGEALQEQLLIVSEVSTTGRTSELLAENSGDWPILLLDGEEFHGSKQNRVLNTSLMLKPNSSTIIPVSCVEEGRSRYHAHRPREFVDSGVVLASRIRGASSASVARAYSRTGQPTSDQGEIWSIIRQVDQRTQTDSPIQSIHDAFEHCWNDIDSLVRFFAVVPEQQGVIVSVKGRIVGMDILSRPDAFARVAQRLLKGYALDAITSDSSDESELTHESARDFLSSAAVEPAVYPSVGLGYDHRFSAEKITGAALVVDGVVVHAALFAVSPERRWSGLSDCSALAVSLPSVPGRG